MDRLWNNRDLRPNDVPQLVSVLVLDGRDESEFLALAGSLAWMVSHPMGAAIVDGADGFNGDLRPVRNFQRIAAEGLSGSIRHHNVILGSSALFAELGLSLNSLGDWAQRLVQQGQRVLFLAIDGETAGFLGIVNRPSRVHGAP